PAEPAPGRGLEDDERRDDPQRSVRRHHRMRQRVLADLWLILRQAQEANVFLIRYAMDIEFVPDGSGALGPYPVGPKLRLGILEFKDLTTRVQVPLVGAGIAQVTGYQAVPGANAPTQNNFRSAMYASTGTPAGGMLLDFDTAIGLDLTRIQGLATGGG